MIARDQPDPPTDARYGSPVLPGEVIAGKYRVERLVGAGGMGVVVAATHLQLGNVVAIKILAPQYAPFDAAVPRFVQEARAAARIQNEHVVRVFDVGVLDGGPPYMAMDYLEGVDLDHMLRRRGPLPVSEAVECLLQACEGINEAHAVGVVHRDLKPGNLVRCEHPGAPPLAKIVDFGVSKVREVVPTESLVKTGPHEIIGSPLYASPEQILSAPDVDERTDIWALGAVFYAALAGRPPFMASTLSELCVRIAQSRPPSVHEVRADVPALLAGIIDRCLAKEARERFQSVAELARALAPFAPGRALGSLDRIASRGAPASLAATLVSAREPQVTPVAPPPESRRARSVRAPRSLRATPEAHEADGALRWALVGALLAVAVLAAALASSIGGPTANAQPAMPAQDAPVAAPLLVAPPCEGPSLPSPAPSSGGGAAARSRPAVPAAFGGVL
jgi:serine/threonine protein kinase